jgi:transcription elongation factor Elf1
MIEPTTKFTGSETCPKCGAVTMNRGFDKEKNVITLQCPVCHHAWDVKPLDAP